ncbi:MAG TPA: type II secretion system minor pseudopilin GspI [Steroidobacteraceae bacterium]
MSGRLQRAKGFTLIEVLVALAIVAVGMAAVMHALTSAAETTMYLQEKTLAEWIALNRIAEVRLLAKKPGEGKTTGEVEYAGRKWNWEQEVQETEVPGMMRIDVSVGPADAPGGRKWLTTVAGIFGDAVSPARGDLPLWDPNPVGPGRGGRGGQNGENDEPGGDRSRQPGRAPEEERPGRTPRNSPTPFGT